MTKKKPSSHRIVSPSKAAHVLTDKLEEFVEEPNVFKKTFRSLKAWYRRCRKRVNRSKKSRERFMKIVWITAGIGAVFVAVGMGQLLYLFNNLVDVSTLAQRQNVQTSVLYDRTGETILYEIYGEENRKVIPPEDVPEIMKIATVMTEDDGFYQHGGIDFRSLARAVITNVIGGSRAQGASTITQQLARNVYLTREKTWKRKIYEAIIAVRIEQTYTKEEILYFYLNEIPYGANAYGIQSASEIYFGKDAKDLTADEAAILASIPKATTYYSPYGNNTDALKDRQQYILERMRLHKEITDEEIDIAQEVNTLEKLTPFKRDITAPHFVFYVRQQLIDIYGEDRIIEGGLNVKTTIDLGVQDIAQRAVSDGVEKIKDRYNAENAALVSIDIDTGEILAMVGSRDYFDEEIDGKVNVATSLRQPGSSFKPYVYAKAFENNYEPDSIVYDIPTTFTGGYKPQNYDGSFHGAVTLRDALATSLNIPAVKVLHEVGVEYAIAFAQRLGISTLDDKNRFGLALVLGGGEITLVEGVAGYAVFANDGIYHQPRAILEITDGAGNVLPESDYVDQSRAVLDTETARKITDVLADNRARASLFGTYNNLYIPGYTTAAKTGTTQEFRDAWTMGYSADVAAGVWVGNNDNTPMSRGADGMYVAAPIWKAFMTEMLKDKEDVKFLPYTPVYEEPKEILYPGDEFRDEVKDARKDRAKAQKKAEKEKKKAEENDD